MIGKYNKPSIQTALQKPSSETNSNQSGSPTSASESDSISLSNLPVQGQPAETPTAAHEEDREMEAPAGMEQPYHTWCVSCRSSVGGPNENDKEKMTGQGCSPPSLFARESFLDRDLMLATDSNYMVWSAT